MHQYTRVTPRRGLGRGGRSLQNITHDLQQQSDLQEGALTRIKETNRRKKVTYPRDSPRHSPGVALLCDVGVGCEYRFAGGGAGGPGGG